MQIKSIFFIAAALILTSGATQTFVAAADAPVRVLIWDERQPQQKSAYPDFLGNQIAAHLKTEGFEVKSVCLNDPEQGLTKENIENCDVLIWWGHIRNREVNREKAKEIANRVKDGKLNLIALHSAHWAYPFIEAMNLRTMEDAMKKFPEDQRATVKVTVKDAKPFTPPKKGDPLTPTSELKKNADGSSELVVQMPICCFPSWRNDNMPSHVTTLAKDHPIAKGIPEKFDITHTEMYSNPFHVPAPDAIIFHEKWDKGEEFDSGCVWKVGKGKVFYFRPGHETCPVYREELPLKIITNAIHWMSTGT